MVKKALMLAFALAACLQMAPVSAAQAAASAAGSTLCLKNQHLIVQPIGLDGNWLHVARECEELRDVGCREKAQ